MTPAERLALLVALAPRTPRLLARGAKTLSLPRASLTFAQERTLRQAFPGLNATPKAWIVPLDGLPCPEPEAPLAAPSAPYDEWCRRLILRWPLLADTLPSKALFRHHGPDRLYTLLAALITLPTNGLITHSDLGAQRLNDSKALRQGALRAWLDQVAAALGLPLVQTPHTTVAIFALPGCAPCARTLAELLAAPLILPPACRRIESHENAAPFHAAATPTAPADALILYTAGMPNAAVCALLRALPQALPYVHYGDTDRAGIRIAQTLFSAHSGTFAIPPPGTPTQPLSPAERHRAQTALQSASGFARTALEALLERNAWHEEEAWFHR
ncbi:MAG: DUF2399 domain-containing protein [Candidatus Spyradenecus sp.]